MATMCRAASKQMFAKVQASRAKTIARQKAEADLRETCPVEQAKRKLRSRGWNVFDASVLGKKYWGSGLIIVGTTPRTAQEVIEMAARIMA